jgi:hypothetical protein
MNIQGRGGHYRQFGLCTSVYFKFGPSKIKTEIHLFILLPDKFGYPIIWVRVRSRPNNIVDVANKKLGYYLVKNVRILAIFMRFFRIILLVICRNKRLTTETTNVTIL